MTETISEQYTQEKWF